MNLPQNLASAAYADLPISTWSIISRIVATRTEILPCARTAIFQPPSASELQSLKPRNRAQGLHLHFPTFAMARFPLCDTTSLRTKYWEEVYRMRRSMDNIVSGRTHSRALKLHLQCVLVEIPSFRDDVGLAVKSGPSRHYAWRGYCAHKQEFARMGLCAEIDSKLSASSASLLTTGSSNLSTLQ